MSINVNVSGNPVSIRRGQMFTTDIENFKKKEFQRRRKARINQVRQQSKHFADDLREVCKKDAGELLSNYEKAQRAALNKISAKKLLNLQQQYNECLENFGLAHKMAGDETLANQIINSQTKKNKRKALERGEKAMEKLHETMEHERKKNTKVKQRKAVSRQMENLRSKMVTQLNKSKIGSSKKKKKKKQPKPDCPNPEKCCSCLTLPCLCQLDRLRSPERKSAQTSPIRSPKTSRPNSPPKSFLRRSPLPTYRPVSPPITKFDSRISEMIQNRKHFHERAMPEYNPNDYEEPYQRPKSPLQEPSRMHITLPTCEPPEPPYLEVTDVTEDSLPSNNNDDDKENISREVSYYDHSNRYSHKYTPRTRLVEKVQVPVRDRGIPDDRDRLEMFEMQRRNELIAQRRGREALKKEKVKRDHDKLLKELSNIKKNEQINNIYTRKTDGHLSEARLQEKNEKRQRNIEAAFEEVYIHKAPLITLESDNSEPDEVDGIDLPTSDKNPSINVAEWKVPSPPRPSSPIQPTESLRNLLERVIAQRELLRQEMSQLKVSTDVGKSNAKSLRKGRKILRQTKTSISTVTTTEPSPTTSVQKKDQEVHVDIHPVPSTSSETRSSNSTSTTNNVPPKKSKNKKIQATAVETAKNKRMVAGGGTRPKKSKDVAVFVNQKPIEDTENQSEPKESTESPNSNSRNGKLIEIVIKVNDKKTNLITTCDSTHQKQPVPPPAPPGAESKWSSVFQKTTEIRETSTSTSYLSPPTIFTVKKNSNSQTQSRKTESKSVATCKKSINEKQTKQISVPKKLDDKTKQLVEKLLMLSKNSIDQLGVSSSSVTTPDLEVVQTTQNIDAPVTGGEEELISELFHVPSKESEEQLTQYSDSPKSVNSGPSPDQMVIREGYTALADFCTERINRLTEMIQQVREDTRKLHTLSPENITQTSYLQLPPGLNHGPSSISDYLELPPPQAQQTVKPPETLGSRTSPRASPPKYTSRPFHDLLKNQTIQSNVDSAIDNLFYQPTLFHTQAQPTQQTNLTHNDPNSDDIESPEMQSEHGESVNTPDNGEYPQNSGSTSESTESKRRPPPAFARAVQKYKIDGAPGKELSTILEASSTQRKFDEPGPSHQYPTEVLYADNNLKSSTTRSSSSDQVSIRSALSESVPDDHSQNVSSIRGEVMNQTDANIVPSKQTVPRNVSAEALKEIDSGNILELRDHSTSSSDSINDVLKQLGLGWAVTTLRKTKQTLELSSSSNSSHRKVAPIDVNLKQLLKQQHRKKITIQSSSTSLESIGISNTLLNIQSKSAHAHDETSLISVQSENMSQREHSRIRGRTSTPVAQHKISTENLHSAHEHSLFTVMNHSDISIIKKLSTSESNINLSVPDVSLDIKKSLKRKIVSKTNSSSATTTSTNS